MNQHYTPQPNVNNTTINHYSLRSSHSGTVVIGGIDFHRVIIGKKRIVKFTLANTDTKPFIITNLFLQQSMKPFNSPNRYNNDKTINGHNNTFNYTNANNPNYNTSPSSPSNNFHHQPQEIFQIVSNFTFPIIVSPNDEFESNISFIPPYPGRFTALLSITSNDYSVPRIQQILLNGEGDIPSSPSQIIYTDNQVPLVIDTPKIMDFNPFENTTTYQSNNNQTNIFKTPGGNLLSNINISNNKSPAHSSNSMLFYDCDIGQNDFISTQFNNNNSSGNNSNSNNNHNQQSNNQKFNNNINNMKNNQNNQNNIVTSNKKTNTHFTPNGNNVTSSKKEKKSVSFSPLVPENKDQDDVDEISFQENHNNSNNNNNISDNYINNRISKYTPFNDNNSPQINLKSKSNNNTNGNSNTIDEKFQQLENKILELSKKINQSNSMDLNDHSIKNKKSPIIKNNNNNIINNNNNNNINKDKFQKVNQPIQVETINPQNQYPIDYLHPHQPTNQQFKPKPEFFIPQQNPDDSEEIKLSESATDLLKNMQNTPLPKGQTPAAIKNFLKRDPDENFSPLLNRLNRFDQAQTPFAPRTRQNI
ncbi:hypothetical protein DICPUDRAFT_97902 [Dictyostelium purpureum]|uniref:Uncharacterized protein n=1 Tax=Dictyostelium purpureum TaxID=5786 RepID=F0ZKU1_DICPU|nr:uncharacterized protein DICPUDRAFT_97902 [Dictyostelium purpureum]EGC35418.1 hypothetical protein DICPUDRAFT_97902 [Dictyostelium purpureum]|eukprot:XP_003288031.1 hypothetical protein DICPUDRAFT_97902 [Dictyostelium purpureum]